MWFVPFPLAESSVIVCDGVSLALGPIISAVSLVKRAEGPLSESAPIGRQVAVRAHAALLVLNVMPYLQQYEVLCFMTTSMREKALRSARGREGDVSASPCMQGEGRVLASATRARKPGLRVHACTPRCRSKT